MKSVVILLIVLLICIGVIVLGLPLVKTKQVEAETELVEAQTVQESQQALTNVIDELLTELREERRLRRELVSQLRLVLLTIVCLGVTGVVIAVLLLKSKQSKVHALPHYIPWMLQQPNPDIIVWEDKEISLVERGQ